MVTGVITTIAFGNGCNHEGYKMNYPSKPNNPPQSNTTSSGGATTHEQSQWLIKSINSFSSDIGSLKADVDNIKKSTDRINDDISKISGLENQLSSMSTTISGLQKLTSPIAIIIMTILAWGSFQLYEMNKAVAINSTQITALNETLHRIEKKLDKSDTFKTEISSKLDLILKKTNHANGQSPDSNIDK